MIKSTAVAVGLRSQPRPPQSAVDLTVAVSSAVADVSQIAFKRPIRVIPSFLADGLRALASSQPRPDVLP